MLREWLHERGLLREFFSALRCKFFWSPSGNSGWKTPLWDVPMSIPIFFFKCFTWHLLLTHWCFRYRMLHKYWWSTFLSSRDKNDEVTSNGSFLPQNEHTGNTCLNSTRFKSKHYISRYVCISVKWVAYKNPIICDALQFRAMIYNISPAFLNHAHKVFLYESPVILHQAKPYRSIPCFAMLLNSKPCHTTMSCNDLQ